MDRRNFFKRSLSSLGKAIETHVESGCNEQAKRWIRPPYAIMEMDFLLACTRCDACIEACPHDVIFKLPATCGVKAMNTPAMDLNHKGCHLCEGWPCVTACPNTALSSEQAESGAAPILSIASINQTHCLPYQGPECGACKGSCPIPSALTWDGPKPLIDSDQCVGCGLCREACFLENKAIDITSIHDVDLPVDSISE